MPKVVYKFTYASVVFLPSVHSSDPYLYTYPSFSISLHDTSDEEFELSDGFGSDYEGMLLLRIRKLESDIAHLQSRLEQKKSDGFIETAENTL